MTIEEGYDKDPLKLYEKILLGSLSEIYIEKKRISDEGCLKYSNLIIEKFAIQSASFFHISSGIIERKQSGEIVKMYGYDLFTVNSILRAIIETYATFHNLFIEPKSDGEREFRVLLWKIDSLYEKEKYKIVASDFDEAGEILQRDKKLLEETIYKFETLPFYKEFDRKPFDKELKKVYSSKVNWKFKIENGVITTFNVIKLIEHTCKKRMFYNFYKYSSFHAHTSYGAIEHFEKVRGNIISHKYVDSLTRLAINLTCLLIYDITRISNNASDIFEKLPTKDFIEGISLAIKRE